MLVSSDVLPTQLCSDVLVYHAYIMPYSYVASALAWLHYRKRHVANYSAALTVTVFVKIIIPVIIMINVKKLTSLKLGVRTTW